MRKKEANSYIQMVFICSRSDECLFASFVTKPGIVVHQHEPECIAKKMGFYLQGQGHSVDLYNQNMTVSTIYLFILKNN